MELDGIFIIGFGLRGGSAPAHRRPSCSKLMPYFIDEHRVTGLIIGIEVI